MAGLTALELPLARPLRTGSGTLRRRCVWIVDLGDGIGEAAPLPGIGTEEYPACAEALHAIVGRIEEAPGDPMVWERWLLEVAPDCPAARFGVDTALWDRFARASGLPARVAFASVLRGSGGTLPTEAGLGQGGLTPGGSGGEAPSRGAPSRRRDPPGSAVGGAVSARVAVNALIAGDTAELLGAARAAVAAGFDTIKLKVGASSLAQDCERVRAVSGLPVALRLDANGAWGGDAAERIAALADAVAAGALVTRVELEQPVPIALDAVLPGLRGLGMAICADESVTSEAAAARLLAAGIDGLVLKPMRAGSWLATARIAGAARRAGAACWLTTTLDGAVARAATCHLAAALDPDNQQRHGLATGSWMAADVGPVETVRAGHVVLGAGPGLGLDHASLRQRTSALASAASRPPEPRR
jgi:L-alanine-DL-glutamate epimerase-like enolase superfamily enzyme